MEDQEARQTTAETGYQWVGSALPGETRGFLTAEGLMYCSFGCTLQVRIPLPPLFACN